MRSDGKGAEQVILDVCYLPILASLLTPFALSTPHDKIKKRLMVDPGDNKGLVSPNKIIVNSIPVTFPHNSTSFPVPSYKCKIQPHVTAGINPRGSCSLCLITNIKDCPNLMLGYLQIFTDDHFVFILFLFRSLAPNPF